MIAEVVNAVIKYLIEGGQVKLEKYFVDGMKIEANGNEHKVVKPTERSSHETHERTDR